jgi:RecA-family ATPase
MPTGNSQDEELAGLAKIAGCRPTAGAHTIKALAARAMHNAAEIAIIQRETGLDAEMAGLLHRYRDPWHSLPDHQEIFCEELERRLAARTAANVIPINPDRADQGNSGMGTVDWDGLDNARSYREREVTFRQRQTYEPPVEPPPPLPFVDMSRWDSEAVPEQEWTVLNRVPRRQVALFSGEGAAGKSTIQLQTSAAHVLGRDWLGTMPEQGPALFIDAEDDEAVIHRRLAAIAKHYGVTFAELIKAGLHLMSFVGRDVVLATPSRSGKIEPTPLYRQLLEAAGDIKPVSIGIASSANVFAGSEIDRSQVQQFIALLTRLAIAANGSVTLLSHPSLTGTANETGLSGNTQWHNAVRARFYLKGLKPREGEEGEDGEEADTDLRELVFKKNNYGPVSESLVLRYTDGLFLRAPGITSLDRAAQEMKADEVFLELLRRFTKENRAVSDRPGKNYAPPLFVREEEAHRAEIFTRAMEGAMRRLFKAGKIWNEPCGKPSRPAFRLAIR